MAETYTLNSQIIYTQLVTQKKSLSLRSVALKFLITSFEEFAKVDGKKNHFTYGWNLKEIWSNMRMYIHLFKFMSKNQKSKGDEWEFTSYFYDF